MLSAALAHAGYAVPPVAPVLIPFSTEHCAMNAQFSSPSDRIQFESTAGAVWVDVAMLEKMKLALLAFFTQPVAKFPAPYREVQDPFARELSTSAVWIRDGIAYIGTWRLESQAGQLVLVRYPPPINGVMYLFHATLVAKDSGWEVAGFEVERESGPE